MSTATTTQAEQEDALREEIARLKLDRRRVDNRIRAQRATLRQFEARVSNIIASPARLWLWDFARKKAADCRSLRTERDQLAELVSQYAAAEAPEGMETLAKDRDRWFDRATAAEAQRDQLAADLRKAREENEALRMGLRLAAEMRERGREAERRYAEWRWNNPIVRAALTPDPKAAGGTAKGGDYGA